MSGVEIQSRGDFRTNLTARIIEALEAGTAPWQKPWDGAAGGFFPVNPITGNAYKGGNAFALMAAGYDDPRWCTFNQASANEWKIREGEKATWVEYWKWSDSVEQVDKVSGKVTKVDVALESPRVFYAKVFNLSQMENVPELVRKQPVWDSHEMAERVIEGSGASFFHDQADRAFYSVTKDEIHLPERVAFSDVGSYYATKLHELGHWTGHGSRMNREFGASRGDVLYAKEELRAELASLFLADRLGLPFEVGNHAAYVGSWIEVLKADKNEIFRAARDAEQIVEYVMGLGLEQSVSVENEVEQGVPLDGQESKPGRAGRVYLNVPYAERGDVKALGARWDKAKELWYAPSTKELTEFQQWLKPVSEADIVADFVKSAGVAGLILKDAPVTDGKWYYVQVVGDKGTEKSGSYKLELGSKPNGFAKNFKFPDMSVGWKYENVGVDKVVNANINESMKAAQAKREQEDLAEKLRVAGMVEVRLAKLPVAGPEHEYLVRKGVGAYGLLRQGMDVVMPLGDVDGKVWSSQTIKPDGTKLNLKGGRKTGSFHLIGDRATLGSGPIAVATGYATAASVFEDTRWHVAVAVDDGNLLVVAKALRERYPEAAMVICGDDDRFLRCTVAWTKEGEYIKGVEVPNSGRMKASEAAEAVGGRAVFPEFDDGDWKGTDFNDIHACGLSACVLGKVALELKGDAMCKAAGLQSEAVLAVASDEVVMLKDIYGRTIRVRQSDLVGDSDRIPTVRENGEIWSGEEIPRSIIKQPEAKNVSSAEEKIRAAFQVLDGVQLGKAYPITVEHNGVTRQFLAEQRKLSDGKTHAAIHLSIIKKGKLLASDDVGAVVNKFRLTGKNALVEEGFPHYADEAELKQWINAGFNHPFAEIFAIKEPDVERGCYRGAVVEDSGARVVQNQGKGTAVSHEKERLDGEVKVGQKVEIGYEGGKGTVRSLEKGLDVVQGRE